MNPRLKTSVRWSAFPTEYTDQIKKIFAEHFKQNLGNNKLVVEGRIYPGEIMLRVGLSEPGRLAQNNFEISIQSGENSEATMERIHICVDAAASMLTEYFEKDQSDEDEEMDLPRIWREFPFNGHQVYFQFSTENTDLEKQANALLGVDEEALLNDKELTDDALDRSVESLDSEDEDSDPKNKLH